jgi:succinate dehydrogenase/fumarate reductase flavoprotein subunit
MKHKRNEAPLTHGKHDEIAGRMDAYRAMFEHACALEVRLRQTERLRDALKDIVIRCREGSKQTDWLPTICSIAENALSANVKGVAQ